MDAPDPAGDGAVSPGPLADVRVVDCSTVIAGPNCTRYLADFGADVVKVERPDGGDSLRRLGWEDSSAPGQGISMWWRLVSRNKRSVVLDFKDPDDLARMQELCSDADVLVENFRPGTLERLGLDPVSLIERNPRLVVTRVTGFGQSGPYRDRPGFATQAEALSGFASLNGQAAGPPLLPPIALTDEVTALAAAFATMVALHSGVGQVVDVNLVETMLQLMGPLLTRYGLDGEVQERLGGGIFCTVPRNTYRTADGEWIAVSSSSDSVAARVLDLVGLDGDQRFASFTDRLEHREEIDQHVAAWIAERTAEDVLAAFEGAGAAAAHVHDIADIFADPHFTERQSIAVLDGVPMPGLIAGLSATPGRLRWVGEPLPDADPAG
ncbi:MAG: CoA transferase [Actinobacteria bacterium]|nr:CoA transferase [Actinomycetota bacterium]